MRTLAAALGLCVACGYAPVRSAPRGPLAVATVKNDTAQAEPGAWLERELRAELAGRGRLAAEGAQAPALEVELVSLRSYPSAMGVAGAAAWRVDAEVRAHGPGFDGSALGSEDYLAGVDVPGTEANRRAALRRLARGLARELVERFEVAERIGRQ